MEQYIQFERWCGFHWVPILKDTSLRPCRLAKVCSLVGWFQARSCRCEVTDLCTRYLGISWYIQMSWVLYSWEPKGTPPRKYGFNKALLRESNGWWALFKALFLGGVALGGPLRFSWCMSTLYDDIWCMSRTPQQRSMKKALNYVAGCSERSPLKLVVMRCCKGGTAPNMIEYWNLQWNTTCRFFRHAIQELEVILFASCYCSAILLKYTVSKIICDEQTR